MADLAGLRAALDETGLDSGKAADQVVTFAEQYGARSDGKALLEPRQKEIGASLLKRVDAYLEQEKNNTSDALKKSLEELHAKLGRVRKLLPEAVSAAQVAGVEEKVRGIEKNIEL